MNKYSTDAGIELTEEEAKLVDSIKRLATKWRKTTNRLWLFSGAGTLHIMMQGDIPTNPEPEMLGTGGLNPKNVIDSVDIINDGGDW